MHPSAALTSSGERGYEKPGRNQWDRPDEYGLRRPRFVLVAHARYRLGFDRARSLDACAPARHALPRME